MGVTRLVAKNICSLQYEQLPDSVIKRAKQLILDAVGVGLAGSCTFEGQTILDLVKELGGNPEATVLGAGIKTSCLQAALANGSFIHSVELDDHHNASHTHPGAPIIGAALAAAEKAGATGKQFITAVVAAYEVMTRIGKAVSPSHHYRGYQPTATCGVFGAAAAAGKLLGLDETRMSYALGLAGTQAAGLWEFITEGAMSKRLHPGRSAASGLLAALLAARYFTGPTTILEGKYGFCRAYADTYNLNEITAGWGENFEVMQVSLKYYACCRHAHSPIDAILELKSKYNLIPEKIASIIVATNTPAAKHDNPQPGDMLAAQMSLPYCIAAALIDGKVTLEQFTPAKINDPLQRAITRKVELVVDPQLDALYPVKWAAEVTVKMDGGTTYSSRKDIPKGDPAYPLTDSEIGTKFSGLAGTRLAPEKVAAVLEFIDHLEEHNELTGLFNLLANGGAGQ
ncbi:MAG: hypothetical protein PWP65_496 [Clostridia bacterium]|nr:hypothetical protein [Clostridia bacterium]